MPPGPGDRTTGSQSPHQSRMSVAERHHLQAIARTIAGLLDTAFVIPGTRVRIGLDPLLGLIPGLGDFVSNCLGSVILFLGLRLGVPRIVMVRMALNVFLNMVGGSIPGFGDLFSAWFKSNVRNAALLDRYSTPTLPSSTASDWLYSVGILAGLGLLLITVFLAVIWAIANIWRLVT